MLYKDSVSKTMIHRTEVVVNSVIDVVLLLYMHYMCSRWVKQVVGGIRSAGETTPDSYRQQW